MDFEKWTRRIIAIGVTFGIVGVLCALALDGNERAEGALGPLVVAIIGWYFNSKTA